MEVSVYRGVRCQRFHCTCTPVHRQQYRGGGPWPPTFSRLTHPLLPYAKQKHRNLSCLYKPSVSSESKLLVSLLLCLSSTVFPCYSLLLLQLCYVSRTSLPLISGCGIKISRAKCHTALAPSPSKCFRR